MFWSLFIIGVLANGQLDYTDYGVISNFETRYDCEKAKEYLIEQLGPPPAHLTLMCVRTDQT